MDTTDRTIMKRFILGIVLILLVGVIIWVFFFRDDAKKSTSETTTGSSQQAGEENPGDGQPNKPASGSQEHGAATRSGEDNRNQQQADTLADTGPGNVALLFTGTAALGALGHHVYSRRRQRRTHTL